MVFLAAYMEVPKGARGVGIGSGGGGADGEAGAGVEVEEAEASEGPRDLALRVLEKVIMRSFGFQ